MKLTWVPKRKGSKYCSSACGRGCTYSEYLKAESAAKTLAKDLTDIDTDIKSGLWKVRIWENLGWHYSVSKGLVEVHCYAPNWYGAFFQASGPWGGNAVERASTPQKAVRKVLSKIKRELVPMIELAIRLEG